jgi:sirohydrochlorin ferrochelatase
MNAAENKSEKGDRVEPRPEWLSALGLTAQSIGIVIVDHGSRRDESNELLLRVAAMFQELMGWPIVEPAHMELAEPSIETAFSRAVARGATLVVVHPYLLAPGRHWRQDIPRLADRAARRHEGVKCVVTAPLGLHHLMAEVIQERIVTCINHALQDGPACDHCQTEPGCRAS